MLTNNYPSKFDLAFDNIIHLGVFEEMSTFVGLNWIPRYAILRPNGDFDISSYDYVEEDELAVEFAPLIPYANLGPTAQMKLALRDFKNNYKKARDAQ